MKLFKTAIASFLVMGALALGMPSQASAFWPHYHQGQHSQYNRDHAWNRNHRYGGNPGYGWNGNRNDRYRGNPGYGWNRNQYRPYAGRPGYGWNQQYTPYAGDRYAYNNGYNGQLGRQALPANGEGLINKRNPNLYWACNSDGNHCHWQPRF